MKSYLSHTRHSLFLKIPTKIFWNLFHTLHSHVVILKTDDIKQFFSGILHNCIWNINFVEDLPEISSSMKKKSRLELLMSQLLINLVANKAVQWLFYSKNNLLLQTVNGSTKNGRDDNEKHNIIKIWLLHSDQYNI